MGQGSLSGYGRHVRAADLDVDDRALFPVVTKRTRDFIRKNREPRPHFTFGDQITGECPAAADGLDLRVVAEEPHGAVVNAVRVLPQLRALLSEERGDGGLILLREIADGHDIAFVQSGNSSFSGEQKITDWQRLEDLFVVLAGDDGGSVGFLIIAAHLGEDLTEGYADGDGDSDLALDTGAQLISWIPDDGSEPEKTWRDLSKGDYGDDVTEMQNMLLSLGYDLGSYGADGDFGSATDKAVRAFQKNNALDADGVCGEKTWAALLKLVEAEGDNEEPDQPVVSVTSSGNLTVAPGTWNLRTGPGEEFAIAQTVSGGTKLQKVKTDWVPVLVSGRVLWCAPKAIQK